MKPEEDNNSKVLTYIIIFGLCLLAALIIMLFKFKQLDNQIEDLTARVTAVENIKNEDAEIKKELDKLKSTVGFLDAMFGAGIGDCQKMQEYYEKTH
ncbi:MAG: hypothetical protein WC477_06060 [Patescibacteria group bacterium]